MEKLYDSSWAVLIGIGTFKNPLLQKYSLSTTLNDVKKIKETLTSYCDYNSSKIIELIDEDATLQKIKRLFDDELPKKIKANDRLLVFYSGHGIIRDQEGREPEQGYLVPHDTKLKAGRIVWSSMLPLNELVLLAHNKTTVRQLFFMIDCCFSGMLKQDPEYEAQRNLCPREMVEAAKNKQCVHIYAAANRDEEILASSGMNPPISVFTESIENVIKNINPLSYPEKFLSAYKLAQKVTTKVRETSILLEKSQNPQFIFSRLDKFGEFVFKQFTDVEIANAKQPVINYEPVEKLLINSKIRPIFAYKNLVPFKRFVEKEHGEDYSLLILQKTIQTIINNHEAVNQEIDKMDLQGLTKQEVLDYVSNNIVSLGLAQGVFKPKFIDYIADSEMGDNTQVR